MDWLQALVDCRSGNVSCVVVMIVSVEGSAPRIEGTRLVVTESRVFGTIGGGALELEGISHARALLQRGPDTAQSVIDSKSINLGPDLAQCCGGRVQLQFDCHFANDFRLHIIGAGHVAQEVLRLALRLPCVAVLHDTRTEWLDKANVIIAREAVLEGTMASSIAGAVSTQLIKNNIYTHIENLPPEGFYLVMTHSHELDMEAVEAVLSRNDAVYCGLIASKSKAVSFRHRLERKGFTYDEISQLTSPLGKNVKTGSTPMEVAIAAMADVLTAREEHSTPKVQARPIR